MPNALEPVELKTRTIVAHRAGPHLLITAGVHGDEYEPMAAVRRLADVIEPAALRGRVTLVPVVNEAAFARGRRVAEDGLDLARVCPGRDDGTMTERVAAALARLIRSADFYIDLHTTGALYQILPLAGYMLVDDSAVLDRQRRMARAFNLDIVWGTSARLEGRSLSVARDAGVPAIYVENGGGGPCDIAKVDDCVQGCLDVAAALGMRDGPAAEHRVRYVVEDDRDESGHLQRQHVAPAAGFFQPAAALGSALERGDAIGHVVGPLGDVLATVHAAAAGTLLFLRTSPSVAAGDPLAAILPIQAPGEVSYRRGS